MNATELVILIKERPALYIGSNSISCLKSFIDGWYFRNPNENVEIEIFDNFNKWIQERYEMDNKRNWDRIILFYSSDESNALTNFFKLFEEFLLEN